MVQTRRSLSKSPVREKSETPRSRRRETRNVLRSQSTGLGITIADTTTTQQPIKTSKKIVFDEEGNAPQEEVLDTILAHSETKEVIESTATDNNNNNNNKNSDDDDDDDAIEEVKGSDAKTQIQEQRIIERSTARESTAIRGGPKRKRKQKVKEEDDLNDDFFEQLDAEMEQEKKESKEKKKKKKNEDDAPQGTKITFVAQDEALQNHITLQKDHNIQVVVLNDDINQIRSGAPVPLVSVGTPSVSTYSRFHLINGNDEPSAKQLQKAKKTGRKPDETWTRSRKVTQKLLGGRGRVLQTQDMSSKVSDHTVVIRL